jgi:hypothetical protein
VSYPGTGKVAYRPPAAVRVEVGPKQFEPRRVELKPGQGMLFECKAPSRIKIELLKADDGPRSRKQVGRSGWKKNALPKTKA